MREESGMVDARARQKAIEELLDVGSYRSAEASARYGKSLRKAVPRDVAATWRPPVGRIDPCDLLFMQDKDRVPELIPIRHERMSASPFAFFRGAALLMASDLASLPTTGVEVQMCGDAHISNFGVFLSPERRTVFDINDFDETTRGPWEWDVARLCASVEICGRERGFSPKKRREAVLAAARSYRECMRTFAKMGNLDVWYAHLDVDSLMEEVIDRLDGKRRKKAAKSLERAKEKNSARAVSKFTEVRDGRLQVVSDPPLIVPIRDVVAIATERLGDEDKSRLTSDADVAKLISTVFSQYFASLPPERAALLKRYHGVGMAHKVVGVGSVGLQAWIVVLEGASTDDVVVLQVKEAGESVFERFVGKAPQANHGQRVVEGQHAMQTVSDMLLGWTSLVGPVGRRRDFYVRQLWDGKGSIDLETIEPKGLVLLGRACGWTLAHAHARTGDRFAIASYLGGSDRFDEAMYTFSTRYADQNEQDFDLFKQRV